MANTYQYKAFISYSHSDKAAADRLLRDIENYRVPRRLVGTAAAGGTPIPARVGHIFRDRDELPAAEDLTAEVKKALRQSEFMIVLCSPAAAASRWVNREIIEFKKLTGERRILSVVLSGEPFASSGGAPEQECFPPALRFKLGQGGTLTTEPAEPLAADFRDAGDGPRRGRLKLVAGLLGISLDALIERDLQRKMRRVMAVTAASVAAMIGMASLTYEAVTARQDAERHRSEAEGLIEFMLTDLRQELIGVGRLDVMTDVNERAMEYYQNQGNLNNFPTESLDRRARILLAMGVDDEGQGNIEQARAKYTEYHRTQKALWENAPTNPDRIFSYANSINRLAITSYTNQQLDDALPQFLEAKELLDTILLPNSKHTEHLALASLVNGNLCATYIGKNENIDEAISFCRKAVAQSDRLFVIEPDNRFVLYERIFHTAWLGEGLAAAGDTEAAESAMIEAVTLSDGLVFREPKYSMWKEQQMEVYTRYAKYLHQQNQVQKSVEYLSKAQEIVRDLVLLDPANTVWADFQKKLETLQKTVQ